MLVSFCCWILSGEYLSCKRLSLGQHVPLFTMAGVESCLICDVGGGNDAVGVGRYLTPKGLATLIEASRVRGDKLSENFPACENSFVHNACYKSYTAKTNLSSIQRASHKSIKGRTMRSTKGSRFAYDTHCLICARELDHGKRKKNPRRHSEISSVHFRNNTKGKISIQDSVLAACEKRLDESAIAVKSRVMYAQDIIAVDAKYHRTCMQKFLSGRSILDMKEENMRNFHAEQDDAFSQLCLWLQCPEQASLQLSLDDLRAKMATFLPVDTPTYSVKHMKRRLIEHFANDIVIAEVEGKQNVVMRTGHASTILHDSLDTHADDGENMRQAQDVGKAIMDSLRKLQQSSEVYPTPRDVEVNSLP